jgi:Bacterial regulatory helix-turn-helix protein, lysR family
MTSEHVTVDADGTRFSGRFGAAAQAHLKALSKSDTKKCQNYAKPQAETMHIRMIDLNLFRVFDAMMLHRSVRRASQMLSVTPSAVSHALSRLRQSIGDELFIPSEFGMQPTRRALDFGLGRSRGIREIRIGFEGGGICALRLRWISGKNQQPKSKDVKKQTVAALLVKTLVLAGVIRLLGVAGDSLIGGIETVRDSKDITWIPLRDKDVGAFDAGAEAHLNESFPLETPASALTSRIQLNDPQSTAEYLSLSQEQSLWNDSRYINDTRLTTN